MTKQELCRNLRKEFNKPTLALIIYYGILNAAVILVMIVDAVSYAMSHFEDPDLMDAMMDRLMSNGWGYILAIAIGAVILLAWKKPNYCFRELWRRNRPMTAGSFFGLLVVFLSGQALALGVQWLLALMGMDMSEAVDVSTDSVSMFLYACILAPISEEILFRGLILRSFQPFGKKFAIFASAFLFGIYHGNFIQSPFAFVVGLVLGYVAVEYSMFWSILLHAINNMVLGDLIPRLLAPLPMPVQDGVMYAIIFGSALAALVLLLVRRREVANYFRHRRIHPLCMKSFFSAPAVIILTVLMAGNAILVLLML